MTGRPSEYSPEIAAAICERLAAGESLRVICAGADMPAKSTVFRWLADPGRGEFRDQYARAREAQVEHYVEEILEIADDTGRDNIATEHGERCNTEWVQRSRVRIDTRKWLMSKLAPKKYGDKLELAGSIGLRHEDALAALDDDDGRARAGDPGAAAR